MPIDLEALDRDTASGRLINSQRAAVERLTRRWDGPTAPARMTDKQCGLVYVLLRQLTAINPGAGADGRAWFERHKDDMTKIQASDWITRIKAKITEGAPDRGPAGSPASSSHVWAEWRRLAGDLCKLGGRYGVRFAVPTEDGARNQLAFWWIVPAKDGARFFLRQVIGGQGPVRVRMSPEAMIGVARKAIEHGPEAAMARYGIELGHCGRCGRELTNDESRALGIGPECRKADR